MAKKTNEKLEEFYRSAYQYAGTGYLVLAIICGMWMQHFFDDGDNFRGVLATLMAVVLFCVWSIIRFSSEDEP